MQKLNIMPRTEATIRPIFQRPSFGLQPKIFYDTFTTSANTTRNLTLRPGKGETWSLLFASAQFTDADSATDNLDTYIILTDGSTSVYIDNRRGTGTATNNQQSRVSLGSSANGPIQITNDKWLVIRCVKNGTSTTATGHLIGIVSVN